MFNLTMNIPFTVIPLGCVVLFILAAKEEKRFMKSILCSIGSVYHSITNFRKLLLEAQTEIILLKIKLESLETSLDSKTQDEAKNKNKRAKRNNKNEKNN